MSLVFSRVTLGCLPFTTYCAHRRSNALIRSDMIPCALVSVSNCTREAGVRSRERKIGGVIVS